MADDAQPSLPQTQLPASLVQAILTLLPADARARCAAVSRAWRAAASDAAVWREVDLTLASGLTCPINPPDLSDTRI